MDTAIILTIMYCLFGFCMTAPPASDLPHCSPGKHLDYTSRLCVNCTEGVDFTSNWNQETECLTCLSSCGTKRQQAACTTTSNTVCGCNINEIEREDGCSKKPVENEGQDLTAEFRSGCSSSIAWWLAITLLLLANIAVTASRPWWTHCLPGTLCGPCYHPVNQDEGQPMRERGGQAGGGMVNQNGVHQPGGGPVNDAVRNADQHLQVSVGPVNDAVRNADLHLQVRGFFARGLQKLIIDASARLEKSFGDKLTEVKTEVGVIRATVETHISSVNSGVEQLRGALGTLTQSVDNIGNRVVALDTLTTSVDDIGRRLGALDTLTQSVDNIGNRVVALDALTTSVNDIGRRLGALDTLTQSVDNIGDRVVALDTLTTSVDDIGHRLVALDALTTSVIDIGHRLDDIKTLTLSVYGIEQRLGQTLDLVPSLTDHAQVQLRAPSSSDIQEIKQFLRQLASDQQILLRENARSSANRQP